MMKIQVAGKTILSAMLSVALVGTLAACTPPTNQPGESVPAADPMLATFNVDGLSVEGFEDTSQFGGYSARIIGFNGEKNAKSVIYIPISVEVTPALTAAQQNAGSAATPKSLIVKSVTGISGYKALLVTDLPDNVAVSTPGQALYDQNLTYDSVDSDEDGNVDALQITGDKALTMPDVLLREHPTLTKLKYEQLPLERFGLPVTAADSFVDAKVKGFSKTVKAADDVAAVKAAIKKIEAFNTYLNQPTAYAAKKIKALKKTANSKITSLEKAAAAPQTVTLTINMGKKGASCPELYFVKDGKQTLVQAVSKWIIDGKQVSDNKVFDQYFYADDWKASKHTVTVVMSTTLAPGTYVVKFAGEGAQKTLGSVTVAGKPITQTFNYY